MSGFTKSYRQKWEHPVFRNLREAAIWAWMCDTAVWKDTTIRFNGELVHLKRGQLATSIRYVSSGFEIGERVTRTFWATIEDEGMITKKTTHKVTIITICNYDKYQENEQAADKQPTSSRQAADTNKKEGKKEKKGVPTLQELSLDHVSEWLSTKRSAGIFLDREPMAVLEGFKDYCLSNGKKYKDYPAALRNAFGWERFAGAKAQKQSSYRGL